MKHYSNEVVSATDYADFIPYLKSFYLTAVNSPQRPHYNIPTTSIDSTLLLMPSWQVGGYIGIKVITVFPENGQKQLPTIQGTYLLMSAVNGQLLASFDGPSLTTVRTAAVSGLASSILSRSDSSRLLMIGTGNLCHELIKAHAAVRDLNSVEIWGRDSIKSKRKAETLILPNLTVSHSINKDDSIGRADIVSSATFASEPLIHGDNIKAGSHIDLVGSYTPEMREADDHTLKNNVITVDDYNGLKESGDLYQPIKSGVIAKEDVISDLKMLCRNGFDRRRDDITVFKSVGNAKSDLALATYLFEKNEQ